MIKQEIGISKGESYVTLSFDNYENKAQFMDAYGLETDKTIIKGESFFDLIQNV